MALLTRKQIDAASDLKTEVVSVPEWGGEVMLRELTSGERGLIDATSVVARGAKPEFRVDALKTMRQRVVAAALVDEDGKRLYSDKELALLGGKNGQVIQRLFDKVQEMSGMDAKAVERAEGNSEPAQGGSSDSD